jgi:hypothetical protein
MPPTSRKSSTSHVETDAELAEVPPAASPTWKNITAETTTGASSSAAPNAWYARFEAALPATSRYTDSRQEKRVGARGRRG